MTPNGPEFIPQSGAGLTSQSTQHKTVLSLALLVVLMAGIGCAGSPAKGDGAIPAKSFSVLALSRGAGVPKPTKEVLKQIKNFLETAKEKGGDINVAQYRIGLEGETKLCAKFSDPELGGRLLAQVQVLSRGVDLLNVVVEPCGVAP